MIKFDRSLVTWPGTPGKTQDYQPLRSGDMKDVGESDTPTRARSHMRLDICHVFLASCAALFIFFLGLSVGSRTTIKLTTTNLSTSDLVSRLQVSSVTVEFVEDRRYSIQNTSRPDSIEKAWAALYPPGNGFITSFDPDPNQVHVYNESNKYDFPDLYAVSMFHQLHCLEALSKAISPQPNSTVNVSDVSKSHSPHVDHSHDAHLAHCVSFLRQAIMCAGDTALESITWVTTAKGERVPGVSGVGTVHQCRDFATVYQFTKRHSIAMADRDL